MEKKELYIMKKNMSIPSSKKSGVWVLHTWSRRFFCNFGVNMKEAKSAIFGIPEDMLLSSFSIVLSRGKKKNHRPMEPKHSIGNWRHWREARTQVTQVGSEYTKPGWMNKSRHGSHVLDVTIQFFGGRWNWHVKKKCNPALGLVQYLLDKWYYRYIKITNVCICFPG